MEQAISYKYDTTGRIPTMKKIRIGLVGYGTVGGGLYRLLEQNAGMIAQRTGAEFGIKTICDLRTDREKSAKGAAVTADG